MFKNLNDENRNIYEFVSNKTYNLNQSQVTRYNFVSGSTDTILSRNYDFARINLYLSGSDYTNHNKKLNREPTPGNPLNNDQMFFNKFYVSGSVVSIPQNEFGDRIKPATFTLTDSVTGAIIKDDFKGNLFGFNATFSQSSATSLSSSDNYVGNIFYNLGVFAITETASFDGTNNYSEVTSGNYTLRYKGVHEISTYEYVCNAASNEFNQTQNITIFKPAGAGKIKDHLTGSAFPTYITEGGLYDEAGELMAIGRLSSALEKNFSSEAIIKVRLTY